jgi:hypothetical protein
MVQVSLVSRSFYPKVGGYFLDSAVRGMHLTQPRIISACFCATAQTLLLLPMLLHKFLGGDNLSLVHCAD